MKIASKWSYRIQDDLKIAQGLNKKGCLSEHDSQHQNFATEDVCHPRSGCSVDSPVAGSLQRPPGCKPQRNLKATCLTLVLNKTIPEPCESMPCRQSLWRFSERRVQSCGRDHKTYLRTPKLKKRSRTSRFGKMQQKWMRTTITPLEGEAFCVL